MKPASMASRGGSTLAMIVESTPNAAITALSQIDDRVSIRSTSLSSSSSRFFHAWRYISARIVKTAVTPAP